MDFRQLQARRHNCLKELRLNRRLCPEIYLDVLPLHLQEVKVCLYDCIEFSDRFRYIDIASDMAFFAMDLDFAGRPDLSVFVASSMATLMEDPAMLLLMDFYKGYRACVRAKVEAIRALQSDIPVADKKASQDKIKRYMQLALQYSLSAATSAAYKGPGNKN